MNAGRRDESGDRRDHDAEQRDRDAERRDEDAELRSRAADQRDQAADRRDLAAEHRDQATVQSGATTSEGTASARARRDAASDRKGSSRDRDAGASERTYAEHDRDMAMSDRGAAAEERRHASIDGLTDTYLQGPGLLELERELARARRAHQPVVLAFVEVDHLKAIDDSHGHAARDRMLLEVANTLRTNLRPYDLIVRFGDVAFICAIPGLTIADAPNCFSFIATALGEAPEHGSVTIGYADMQPDDSGEDLIARADRARHREGQKRNGRAAAQSWECGDLVVDELNWSVTRAGSRVPLTTTEFNILTVLIRQITRVVTKDQFFGEVWGYGADRHLLEVHICSLRRKLEVHGPRMIHTIRGKGYVLRP
jgi:diguanylate cyclase (GGDEF)-like protein